MWCFHIHVREREGKPRSRVSREGERIGEEEACPGCCLLPNHRRRLPALQNRRRRFAVLWSRRRRFRRQCARRPRPQTVLPSRDRGEGTRPDCRRPAEPPQPSCRDTAAVSPSCRAAAADLQNHRRHFCPPVGPPPISVVLQRRRCCFRWKRAWRPSPALALPAAAVDLHWSFAGPPTTTPSSSAAPDRTPAPTLSTVDAVARTAPLSLQGTTGFPGVASTWRVAFALAQVPFRPLGDPAPPLTAGGLPPDRDSTGPHRRRLSNTAAAAPSRRLNPIDHRRRQLSRRGTTLVLISGSIDADEPPLTSRDAVRHRQLDRSRSPCS